MVRTQLHLGPPSAKKGHLDPQQRSLDRATGRRWGSGVGDGSVSARLCS